jgi:tetratricopeptide (TPR) repeat protein
MKFIFVLTFNMLLALGSTAQTEKDLVTLANRYEASMNENAAFETFKKVIQVNPKNYYAYWKLSELCSRIGNRRPTPQEKQEFFNAGKSYASMAIRLNPNGADGYYTMAVAMGRLALTQSGRERVNSVKEIKADLEKAISINPNHARAWHVLGKWHYEVSNLNMFEKAALRIVYGGLPSASLNESIKAYERSKQLDPAFVLNYLELAKAYNSNGDNKKAIDLLKKLPTLPNKTLDDPRIKASGAKLLKELTE